jgi:riboflavin synthase
MFTGLVTAIGLIEQVVDSPAGRELRVAAAYDGLEPGESIALNGVCLTVRELGPGWFTVAAVVTTLGRTTVGDWAVGRSVNLERAMRLGDRMGGHLVQGHVDGVGVVRSTRQVDDAWLVDLEVPAELAPLMVPHGSITVDGVSLTVNDLPAPGVVQLSIIEYTMRHTTLGALRPGSRAHVEADVIGKFVQRLVGPHLAAAQRTGGFPFPASVAPDADVGSRK